MMTREINLATQERAAAHINAGEIDSAVDTLFAPDAVDHDPAAGQQPGREGFRAFFRELTTAFPDAQLAAQVTVADDDHVSFAYTLSGHHTGPFQGIEPTGNRVEVRGLQIGRFAGGQIVERWGSTDELGILQQIGAARVDGESPGLLSQVRAALAPGRRES